MDVIEADVRMLCDLSVDAVSFGLSHPGVELSLVSFLPGAAIDPGQGGITPDYLNLEETSVGGTGLVFALLCDYQLGVQLVPGVEHSLARLGYQILPGLGVGVSPLLFESTLGSPPAAIRVVSGLNEIIPTITAGQIERIAGDCNQNGVDDLIDIAMGTSLDCDGNQIPDECDLLTSGADCDGDGALDACEISSGIELDCDLDGVLDSCEIVSGTAADCDLDGVLDGCQLSGDPTLDCDGSGVLDSCDIATNGTLDCDGSGVLDSCEIVTNGALDCDGSGVLDSCEIAVDGTLDCDGGGVLDSCQLSADRSLDCNGNQILDSCDVLSAIFDCDLDGLVDSCAITQNIVPDCDLNGIPDSCDLATGEPDNNMDGIPDRCQTPADEFVRADCNDDESLSIADPIFFLAFLFSSGAPPSCADACDANDDALVDVGDAVFTLAFLFSMGTSPPSPFPHCGTDLTGDQLECQQYQSCR